ncbi:MAG TPA: hypothetical protein PLK41_07860 [Defluviitoga tunisiensis]|nr:hypothetical protein [Defluviitoga tunisiensis]
MLRDYNGESNSAFCWNEFEKMSLSSAEDDSELINEIIEYWDKYLPIALSVRYDMLTLLCFWQV